MTARLLAVRGLTDPDEASRFLNPSLDQLLRSLQACRLGAAVDRLEKAIANRERISVHGDYDVDGITSTVILRRALELLGGDVTHFIPERLTDGYGLQPGTIDRLQAEGVKLIVSVDCGIRGAEAARRAREPLRRGPDHHRPSRTGRRAARLLCGGESQASRLHLSRQEPRRRRRGAQAGAGTLSPGGEVGVAPGFREDRLDRHAARMSCRWWARTASSPRSAWRC